MAEELNQELVAELADKLGDETSLRVMERAERSDNPNDVLRAALGDAPIVPQNGFAHLGLAVVECKYESTVTNSRGREEQRSIDKGWVVAWNGPNRTKYFGQDMAECHTMQQIYDGFPDRDAAYAACRAKADLMERAVLDSALRSIYLELYAVQPDAEVKPKKLQRQLTQRQQAALDSITRAARQTNQAVDGRIVSSDADGMALILERIADVLGL